MDSATSRRVVRVRLRRVCEVEVDVVVRPGEPPWHAAAMVAELYPSWGPSQARVIGRRAVSTGPEDVQVVEVGE